MTEAAAVRVAGAPTARFLERVSRDFARAHLVLSDGLDGEGREVLRVAPGTDPAAVWNTRVRLGREVVTVEGDPEATARAIDAAYGALQPREAEPLAPEHVERDLAALLDETSRDLLSTSGKAPLVRFLDTLLFEALSRGASDVHLQPLPDRAIVRFRVDGTLHTVRDIDAHLLPALVSRVKVMGRMDIAERRIAQDGRATVRIGERQVDLRISTFPTNHGERAVLRLLDKGRQQFELDLLGMPRAIEDRFLAAARRSHGLILVTGPTGSGKTTTLYSTLRRIASPSVNIMTIEDPIEYELSSVGLAVSQSQVQAKKGVSFSTGLRHILRQDPDVVLVGEIRDTETARMAIQSSLTGHLVFSTLHTNDAPSAVTRLIDLGVEPYLLGASLTAVLAQRLVRTVHGPCRGEGCAVCFGTGFLGRIGIFEFMGVEEPMRRLIAAGAELEALREEARRGGLRSLREEGERLAGEERTTLVEVERVVQGTR
ncbi:MAG TPA: GspE/PulE family protein [Planctomycetota bacterium]|nr:GspE/PulE family protein [Planctomycetota bacterium]